MAAPAKCLELMEESKHTYKFGIYLDMTAKAIKQDIMRRFREEGIDLTPEQWTIMNRINQDVLLTQKELAESTFKDAPTVSRIMDILHNKGLLERKEDGKDRRRSKVSLTWEGRRLLYEATPIIFDARNKGWEGLDETDYQQLKRILDKVNQNVSRDT